MYRRCDDTYRWAVYAEFKWGELFFHQVNTYYDIKRDKVYSKFPKEEFYVSPDPVSTLFDYYEGNIPDRILGSYDQQLWRRARAAWISICLSLQKYPA
jgi:hypothetical protein